MLPLPGSTHIIKLSPDSSLCGTLAEFLSEGFKEYPAEQWTENHVRNLLTIGEVTALVDKAGNLISACCSLVDTESVEIISVVTSEDHRKQGYAHALLRHALSTWQKNSVNTAVLVVRTTNVAAAKLYDKCGFQKSGVVRHAYTGNLPEDGLRMLICLNNKVA